MYPAKKLIIPEPSRAVIEDIELPPLSGKTLLVRTVQSSISHGTEMTAFVGSSPFIFKQMTPERTFRPKLPGDPSFYPFPCVGYDAVGIVEESGPDATRFSPGDRLWYPVTHQTYFQVEDDSPHALKLPANVSNDTAVCLNLASVALGAVLDAQVKLSDVVVVFGGGVVGQFVAQEALLSGAREVYVVEPLASRREFAAKHCACVPLDPADGQPLLRVLSDNNGVPPDVVVECSGSVPGLAAAVRTAGVAGRVVAAGFYASEANGFVFGEEFMHNRITLIASMSVWDCPSRFPERWNRARIEREVLTMFERGKLNADGFLTALYPFERVQEAYEQVRDNPAAHMKVALTYG